MDQAKRQRIIVLIMLCAVVVAGNLLTDPGSVRDVLQLVAAPTAELSAILLMSAVKRRKRTEATSPAPR
ncbi:hypothetical protein B1H26_39755 [Amycolatopsis sp. BJA-103]|nr:hypothetical protein BKN51_19660 [Amycolatopsis sp. BJA-103]PNE13593.1 hypothetical protein B1H26_39755 [Amycolatopsis sp. BJA-103]